MIKMNRKFMEAALVGMEGNMFFRAGDGMRTSFDSISITPDDRRRKIIVSVLWKGKETFSMSYDWVPGQTFTFSGFDASMGLTLDCE